MGYSRKPAAPPTISVHEAALRRLARRDHSEKDLRSSLQRAGHAPEAVATEIDALRERGLLNDTTYATRYTRTKVLHARLGSRRIQGALRQKGVANAASETGMREALSEVSEQEALDKSARAYWPRTAKHEPRDRVRRTFAFLMRRGFPVPLIIARLKVLFPSDREALDGLDEIEEPTGDVD